MTVRRFFSVAAGVVFMISTLLSASETAQRPSADDIAKQSNLAYYYGGNDGKSNVKMHLVSKSGSERLRELTILRRDVEEGGDQRYYAYFHEPGDVRKMVFMVWKHIDKDDDRWLYIPAIDLVKRISASDKRGSFAGSAFTYEDVSGRGPGEDIHTFIREEPLGERQAYVIKNVPKDAGLVEFSSYLSWIDTKTFLPLKAEYYDKQEKHYRTVTAEEIAVIQDIPTIIKAKALDVQSGSYTMTEFTDITYNIGLTDDTFTERFLRRPPMQWLSK